MKKKARKAAQPRKALAVATPDQLKPKIEPRSPGAGALNSRLDAITEAQNRARIAFFLSTLAAGIILVALWNTYLSWDRQWAYVQNKPNSWGQEQLLIQQINVWLENQLVGIPLLGVRLSSSDAALLGSLVLLVFSFYYCMCMRRENHEIGSLLLDVKDSDIEVRWRVFYRVRSFMVFNTITKNDAPFDSLRNTEPEGKRILFSRTALWALAYLPVLAVLLIFLSDVYYGWFYLSPYDRNVGPRWNSLGTTFRVQLVLTDAFALLLGVAIWVFCNRAMSFHKATGQITEEFFRRLKPAETEGPNTINPLKYFRARLRSLFSRKTSS